MLRLHQPAQIVKRHYCAGMILTRQTIPPGLELAGLALQAP